jgi:hypothetical protein
MKRTILSALAVIMYTTTLNAQAAKATWGEEFKVKKENNNLEVVYIDKTCIFLKESHFIPTDFFSKKGVSNEAVMLVKYDADMKKLFEKDYDKELKGKAFETFFFLKDKAFLMASIYYKSDLAVMLLAVEIDKNSGELVGDWKDVSSWEKEKNGAIGFRALYNYDSSKMVLASAVIGENTSTYDLRQFNSSMEATKDPIISFKEFDPKTFILEDLVYTTSGNIVLVGRQYIYPEGKKKTANNLELDKYIIRLYDAAGKQLKQFNADSAAKCLISVKVKQLASNDLIFAAFYGDKTEIQQIRGMMIQRINPINGEIVTTCEKVLHTYKRKQSDGKNYVDKRAREEKELEKKSKQEAEPYSKDMGFRGFILTADNGVVILAEKQRTFSYPSTNGPPSQRYEYGDILMTKMGATGHIEWLHIMPKDQQEDYWSGLERNNPGIIYNPNGFFLTGYNPPFYAGLGVLASKNAIHIFFNDYKKNEDVLKPGQSTRMVDDYDQSYCFAINLNPINGEYARSKVFYNKDVPTAMPRFGLVWGSTLYLPGYDKSITRTRSGAIAKINIE